MKTLTINNYNFRVKKMNAIQLLALRSQINFDDYEKVEAMYELFLNFFEVECNDQWLPVREEGKNGKVDYYPAGIEDDANTIEALINYFQKEVIMPFFKNSNASK